VIVFRNYIEAALIAHAHLESLNNLITAASLARITRAALEGLEKIDFQAVDEASRKRLHGQYGEDAAEAFRRLKLLPGLAPACEEDVRAIGESELVKAQGVG
jgi:hypothetical protein